MRLRASTKFIRLGYVLCLVMAVGLGVFLKTIGPPDVNYWGLMIIPIFLAILVMIRHIKRRLMKLEVIGDRLRFESGFLSKTTRTVELVKVQDVRVDQTFGQRLVGLGDISFETAGESSRVVMRSIDNPQLAADHILELAKSHRLHPDTGQSTPQTSP